MAPQKIVTSPASRPEEQVQVVGEDAVAGHVGEDGEGGGRDQGGADGEPVQPVREVHRVAGQGEEEYREDHVEETEVRDDRLEERERQTRRVLRGLDLGEQVDGRAHERSHRELREELLARAEAEALLLDHLQVVVGEADRPEKESGADEDPDVLVGEVGPEEGGDEDPGEDQHPAHGRRPRLGLVGLRPLLADVLADLQAAQALDHPRPQHQHQEERGQARHRGAEGDVADDVQARDLGPGRRRGGGRALTSSRARFRPSRPPGSAPGAPPPPFPVSPRATPSRARRRAGRRGRSSQSPLRSHRRRSGAKRRASAPRGRPRGARARGCPPP